MVFEGACALTLCVARASKKQALAMVACLRHRRNILRVSSCLITVSNADLSVKANESSSTDRPGSVSAAQEESSMAGS